MNRNTLQREIVLEAVHALASHPTPESVYAYINLRYPNISRSTVYRNLSILAENGHILRVRIPNAADRFDFNTAAHYHVFCTKCGRVDDVKMPFNACLIDDIEDARSYVITDYSLVFSGICPECNKNNAQ